MFKFTKSVAIPLFFVLFLFIGCGGGGSSGDDTDTQTSDDTKVYNEYFVSSDGSDSADGSKEHPFKSIQKALELLEPGDVLSIRGGTYPIDVNVTISGIMDKPITIQAYSGEKVVFVGPYGDDKQYDTTRNLFSDSFVVKGSWLIIKDLEIKNAATAIYVGGGASNNIFENLSLHDNYWSGMILTDGASFNTVINCDSYYNYDSNTHGQHADGFVIAGHDTDSTPYVGEGNRFEGCRSWGNADDGYDCWEAGNKVEFINCLSYDNGKNIWDDSDFQGDGNGFKLGVNNQDHPQDAHYVEGCKSWDNNSRGFDSNDNTVAMEIVRNVAWRDLNSGYKFILAPHHLVENIAIDCGENYIDDEAIEENNSWNGLSYTIKSFDDTAIRGPRDEDGNFVVDGFLERE
ncbi:MAG: DUF1565 domain-containing protein [Epsilonproteobacteria bacterium]|nr:DUF1565 domain-containing protein [Campylobacterota bacterium]